MQASFKKLLKEEQASLNFGSNNIQNVWLKVKPIFSKPVNLRAHHATTGRKIERKYKLPKASKFSIFYWGIGMTTMYLDEQEVPLYAWVPDGSHDFEEKIHKETGVSNYSQVVRQSGKVLESRYDSLVLFKRD